MHFATIATNSILWLFWCLFLSCLFKCERFWAWKSTLCCML